MRRSWQILKRIIVVLVLVLIAATTTLYFLVRASLPQLQGNAVATSLHATVSVERDALGVATIRGANRNDVSFALGYVHAQERYFSMDLMRRLAAGELAELVGGGALATDKQHRPFRMRARAEQVLAALPLDQRSALTAYRDGVNAGLAALASRPWEYWLLGAKPVPWTEADSILVLDAMAFDLNDTTNAKELAYAKMKAALPHSVFELMRTGGGPFDAPLLGPPLKMAELPPATDIDLRSVDPKLMKIADVESTSEPGLALVASAGETDVVGSNSFAMGGSLTASHVALVANDMHLGLRVPNIWFRSRLQYPNPRRSGKTVDIIGVTLPGLPATIVGSNRRIAWAFTNSYGDWLDWVRVNLDPADTSRYRDAAGLQPLMQTIETIKVHGAPDEKLDVRETQWGPILAADADGTPLALAWSIQQPGGVNLELLDLDVAETVDEASDLANKAGMPVQNFVVGDYAGNIGWTLAGRIPRRIGNYDPQLPSDWSQPGTGWDGWLDPADYPHLPNPQSARLWTANARTLDVDSPEYKRVGDGGYDLGARQAQIRDDLKGLAAKKPGQVVPADFLAIQLDDRAVFLARWHKLLHDTLLHAHAPELVAMQKYTDDWNDHADPKSVGYELTRAFRQEVIDTVLDGFAAAVRAKFSDFALPRRYQGENIVDPILLHRPANLLPPGYASWDDLLQRCAQRVAAKLAALPGGIAARTWGDASTVRIRHPLSQFLPGMGWLLDMPIEQLPGDSNMPRVQGPNFGASERFGVEPGREESGYLHMPGGQSGNFLSPFYGSGHSDWAQGKATPFMPGATKYTFSLCAHACDGP